MKAPTRRRHRDLRRRGRAEAKRPTTTCWCRSAAGRTRRSTGLDKTKVKVDAKGFIETDGQRRTAEPTIFAIGDVAGEPMLAHKASHEARVAVEAIAGHKAVFEPAAIPAVVFTDPEIAWAGLTEAEAEKQGRKVEVAKFPWPRIGPRDRHRSRRRHDQADHRSRRPSASSASASRAQAPAS